MIILILIAIPILSLLVSGFVVLRGMHAFTPGWAPGVERVCAQCWYDLHNLQSETCPECGSCITGGGSVTRRQLRCKRNALYDNAKSIISACFMSGGLLGATLIAFWALNGFIAAAVVFLVVGTLCPILIECEFRRIRARDVDDELPSTAFSAQPY